MAQITLSLSQSSPLAGPAMHATVDRLVRTAIRTRHLIQFHYRGCWRIAEPHGFGLKDGAVQLLIYQTGGESRSGRLPNWRRVFLHSVRGLRVVRRTFAGPRPGQPPRM